MMNGCVKRSNAAQWISDICTDGIEERTATNRIDFVAIK